MKLINVAAGVVNQTPLDWQRNRKNIVDIVHQARERNVSVLCLPEMCITGYGCEDSFHSPGVLSTAQEILVSLASESKGIVMCVGLPILYAGGVFNTVCLLVDGQIAGFVAKRHLAGDGIHYEQRWFKPWPAGFDGMHEVDGIEYPIGDLLFEVGRIRIGFEICEDAWVGSRPGARHAARGADIIMNPSASHFAFDKHAVRRRFVIEGSRAFNVTYIYTNMVGNESGRAIFDGDAIIATGGTLLSTGKRLSFEHALLTSHIVDIETTRMTRARTGSFEPDVDGDESDVIEVPFEFPKLSLVASSYANDPWESSPHIKHEEFTRSVGLGLFDYMCKSKSHGFVVSLSGGADSASTAVLVAMALRLADRELGFERLKQRLDYIIDRWDRQPASVEELIGRLLTTVYQSTRNSSDTTRGAARDVARGVGSWHLELDVDPIVESYTKMISDAMQMKLDWQHHDIALQNIQARARAPGVWMIANLTDSLLLASSNRSESAVGYATMDGDTCGGLSPLAGIDKAYLRKWLKWMETDGPIGLGKIPELGSVNRQQPTAELRPSASNQTDEGDLMPYDVLDYIERLAIRDKMMPIDVFEHLRTRYDSTPIDQLGKWTINFFRLWCRNQWKRERYAPSFHLDDENLDPKTWCRFPILSGGYEHEIEKLKSHLEQLAIASK